MLKSQNTRMLWSRLFIPTLKVDPNEPGKHHLTIRAGYARSTAKESVELFLGQRVLAKIAGIARQELGVLEAQEVLFGDRPETAAVVAREIRSYRQLPQLWFQIEGWTLTSWAFAVDRSSQESQARELEAAFRRILDRCGMDGAHERLDDREPAAGPPSPPAPDPPGDAAPEAFPTPGKKTIAEVAAFDGLPDTSHIKTLVMVCDGEPVLVLLRGDHSLSERKLMERMDAMVVRPARPEELREWMKADAGSLGPCGGQGLHILADHALEGRRNMIAGANRNDMHLRHVTPGRDFLAEYADLREAHPPRSSTVGRIRTLGSRYGQRMGLRVTGSSGTEVTLLLTTSDLSLSGIVFWLAETNRDADGLMLPASIAPFEVVVTPVNVLDSALCGAASEIYTSLKDTGFDALFDDRDERPGVKFKDSDLIGIPWRVTVGKKLPQGIVEVIERRGRKSNDVSVSHVADFLRERLR